MLLEANDSILRERVGSGAQCYKFKRGFVLAHLVTRFYRCPFGPRILRAPLARAAYRCADSRLHSMSIKITQLDHRFCFTDILFYFIRNYSRKDKIIRS